MSRSCVVSIVEALAMLLILFRCASVSDYPVGGATGWDVGSNMENWTNTTTFYTGDNLVFVYGAAHDVLEVNKDAYETCQLTSPIATYNDGHTVIPLDNPGTRYFICGSSGHCESGLKVQIVVQLRSLGRRKRPAGPLPPQRPIGPRPPQPPPSPNLHDITLPPFPPLGPGSQPSSSFSKPFFHKYFIIGYLMGLLVIMVI